MLRINHRCLKSAAQKGWISAAICADAAQLARSDQKLVLVHGGSAEANALGERTRPPAALYHLAQRLHLPLHRPPDAGNLLMAVNGKVNTLLVEQLQANGVNALGLSGLDGRLLAASRKDTDSRDRERQAKIDPR